MKNVLILFAHPKFEQSRTNKALVQGIKAKKGVTFHDLYECYPDFHIDVPFEKKLLVQHDVIVWHHPFYWYSCPPLMKQWIDMVLEFGWAYGPKGNALESKKCLQVITVGGSREVYCIEGNSIYSVNVYLRPFEQTARLCRMEYLPPYAIMGTHKLSEKELNKYAYQYRQIIHYLQEDKPIEGLKDCIFQDDIPEPKKLEKYDW